MPDPKLKRVDGRWQLKCPKCHTWGWISEDQYLGLQRLLCACGWHMQRDFSEMDVDLGAHLKWRVRCPSCRRWNEVDEAQLIGAAGIACSCGLQHVRDWLEVFLKGFTTME